MFRQMRVESLRLHATAARIWLAEIGLAAFVLTAAMIATIATIAMTAMIATSGALPSLRAASPAPQAAPLTITLAGQSMIRSDIRATAPDAVPAIKQLLAGDVIFTNIEGTVAEPGQTTSEGRGFLIPPGALDALQSFGFNLLALSDNHAFDLKVTGVQNTLREADSRHIVHAGTGNTLQQAAAPAYLKTPKGIVALVASASGMVAAGADATADHPGVNELHILAGDKQNEATEDLPDARANTPNPEDAQRILASIREARQHADVVIVYQHNHVFGNKSFSTIFTEGMPERLAPNRWLVQWTHAEIDAGADVVVMHGAPLLHGVEIYKGRPIFYDLGNFIYNVPPVLTYIDEPMAWESAVAALQFQGRMLQSITLRPIVLNNIGQGQPDAHSEYTNNQFLDTRGLPAPAIGARAKYILQRIADSSKPFGTTVTINGETATISSPEK
jgi:poly-gamma-glutamate capsule biosynthesis protein CapA/YwtB (metallophosphatase superfamily)